METKSRSARELVTTLVALTILLLAAAGGVFAYTQAKKRSGAADALVGSARSELERAMARQALATELSSKTSELALETAELNKLIDAFARSHGLGETLDIEEQALKLATAALLDQPLSDNPALDHGVAARIAELEQRIAETIDAWNELFDKIGDREPTTAEAALAEQYAHDISEAAYELADIANGLDSGSSGLTEEEILAYREEVAAVVAEAEAAENLIAAEIADAASGGNTSIGPTDDGTVGSGDIVSQQETVNDIEDDIEHIQDEIESIPNDGSPEPYLPDGSPSTYVEAPDQGGAAQIPVFDDNGRPRLIEGTNKE